MAEQPDLLIPYMAQEVATILSTDMEISDDPLHVFTAFYAAMMESHNFKKHDSYMFIEIVGFGSLVECFVWWMEDDSVLIVGQRPPDDLVVGVLAPGANFHPVPCTPTGIPTLH